MGVSASNTKPINPDPDISPEAATARDFITYLINHPEVQFSLRMCMIDERLADPGPVITELLAALRPDNPYGASIVTQSLVLNHVTAVARLALWFRRYSHHMDVPNGSIPDQDTIDMLKHQYHLRMGI